MIDSKKALKTILSLSVCAILAACGTMGSTQPTTPAPYSSRIDSALQRETDKAQSPAQSSYKLAYLEKVYKRNSDTPHAAANYARALHEANFLNEAALVLAPFADDPKGRVEDKLEFTAIQLAQGNYTAAEEYVQRILLTDETNYTAYNYLGVALDAQEMHEEAETQFRKGLELWEGDPTPIMNNLSLNLITQGKLEEAIEILQNAKALDPNKREIERNLRIATALYQSANDYKTPKPQAKPQPKLAKKEAAQNEDSSVEEDGSTSTESETEIVRPKLND